MDLRRQFRRLLLEKVVWFEIWIHGPGSKKEVTKWYQVSEWANGWAQVCISKLKKLGKESSIFVCVWNICIFREEWIPSSKHKTYV